MTFKELQDLYYDIKFSGNYEFTEKEVSGHLDQMTYLYVIENGEPAYAIVRQESEDGTDYWKEEICSK